MTNDFGIKSNSNKIDHKISAIVILYFSKHLLSGIICNLQQQVKSLGEIILVNNSNEDLSEFEDENIIIVYAKQNLGYGSGLNLGVSVSKYEYLLLLNPDLSIKHFEIQLERFSNFFIISGHNPMMPGYALKFPSLFTTFIQYSLLELIYIKSIERITHFKRLNINEGNEVVDYISGALILTTKATYQKIGGFDGSYFLFYEETDFCKRASALNIPVISSSKIKYIVLDGKASAKNVTEIKIQSGINSSKRYHLKYTGPIQTSLTFSLLKLEYSLVILILFPLSWLSKKIKLKLDVIISHLKYF